MHFDGKSLNKTAVHISNTVHISGAFVVPLPALSLLIHSLSYSCLTFLGDFLHLFSVFAFVRLQEAAFEPLHDVYAKPAVDIILALKGFYVKVKCIVYAKPSRPLMVRQSGGG